MASLLDDLVNLEILNDEAILHSLRGRYNNDSIYTKIGDILVAVNPYKHLDLYNKQTRSVYNHDVHWTRLPPHIYGTSLQMHESMLFSSESQCCVVSGESGAGKTEITKLMIDHVIHLCKSDVDDLQEKIIQVNPLLEAFGNAQTSMNGNSSRFGKYIEVHCSQKGKVLGASIAEYLLEKSRVVHQSKDEGSYHIFNYLLAGLPEQQLNNMLLNRNQSWRYLHNDSHIHADESTMSSWMLKCKQLIDSMESVGFSMEDIYGLFTILSAVLNIGEIKFEFDDRINRAFVTNIADLDKVAVLLGLESDDLECALTSNIARTNDLTITSFKTVEQANDSREAIAKSLYGRLFGWIVQRINLMLLPVDANIKKSNTLTLGFLDIFGFENFAKNSFEQLCINVANEQLHFYFVQHVFAWEQLEYSQEEIDADIVSYHDNRDLISLLLEKPLGLFALLDEESNFPQADDNTLVSKFNAHCIPNRSYICFNRKEPSFGIRHFAGEIMYNADGFLEKNRDTLGLMILDCLKISSDTLVSSLYNSVISRTGSLITRPGSSGIAASQNDLRVEADRRQRQRLDMSRTHHHRKHSSNTKHRRVLTGRKQKKPLTVSAHFRNSLVDLMEKILSTQPHFVRCIKPNPDQQPNLFIENFVQHQLRYTGILETVEIRRNGFPVRIQFKAFLERYKFISFPMTANLEATQEHCSTILEAAVLEKTYRIGKSKLFLKQRHIEDLTRAIDMNHKQIIIIQKVVRGKLARIRFGDLVARKNMEERNVGSFLISISTKSNKILESLMSLNEQDLKRMERKLERESKRMDTHKKKLAKSNSDSRVDENETRSDGKREQPTVEVTQNKTGLKRTAPISSDLVTRNFSSRNHPAWCRIDCFERQHHVASYKMGRPVVVIDGADNPCEPSRISFGKMPSPTNDSKVLKIRSCIGKGLQLHQDDEMNLWATRHGKNPIYARGYTLCPELIKLDGKLTQGVPMKVFDVALFEQSLKEDCENFDDGDEAGLKEKLYAMSKVCMSFIKDTVVDEETPCWIEIWMLKHLEKVKGCIRDYKLKRHVQSRLETDVETTPAPQPAVVASSPPRSPPKATQRKHTLVNADVITPAPLEGHHEPTTPSPKSLRNRMKKQSLEDAAMGTVTETRASSSSPESSPPLPLRTQGNDSREGMSYRQVFGIRPTDYFFEIEPPAYSKPRRYSDSDSESLRNFLQAVLPRQTSLDTKEKSSPFQPKKWIKRARKKSEERKKSLAMRL